MFNLIRSFGQSMNRIDGLFVCLNVDVCMLSVVKIALSEECRICKGCFFASPPSFPTLLFFKCFSISLASTSDHSLLISQKSGVLRCCSLYPRREASSGSCGSSE